MHLLLTCLYFYIYCIPMKNKNYYRIEIPPQTNLFLLMGTSPHCATERESSVRYTFTLLGFIMYCHQLWWMPFLRPATLGK